MSFNFACHFLNVEDGSQIIKCRDLPELLSWPENGETLEQWSRYAVMDCILFRMKDGEIIPSASKAESGEYVVRLSASVEAKIHLHNTMVEQGVSRVALSKLTGLTLPEVSRLLNINQPTKIDTVVSALNHLGKDLKFSLVSM